MAASTSPAGAPAPAALSAGASPDTAPQPLTPDQLTATSTIATVTTTAEPLLSPPGAPQAAAAGATAAAVWQSTKKVLSLWTNNADRNGYAYVDGIGWKRLATTSDSVHEALLMLASSARLAGSVTYPEAGDGLVHEIYLW